MQRGSINHIAIIMDGNRRWAASRGLKSIEGHRFGVDTLVKIVNYCSKLNIPYLTVYALSTENFSSRSPIEIAYLLKLMQEQITKRIPELKKERVRVNILGDLAVFPFPLRKAIAKGLEVLNNNDGLQLNIAVNYGSRAEIVRAAREVASVGQTVSEEDFSRHLYTKDLPDPDLIIRTGGEKRLSNFLLWQAAYSELFFTDTLWPDFDSKELNEILKEFGERKRNFGR